MSQREEEETSSGGSATGDPIDIASESSVVPDFFAESFTGKPVTFFSATSDNVGVGLADLPVEDEGENGGEGAPDALPDDEEGFVPRIVEGFDVTEAAMAETLINGLHLSEHTGGVVAVRTEDRDQRMIVPAEQHAVSSHQLSDQGERVRSAQKRGDNGSGNQRLGEQHAVSSHQLSHQGERVRSAQNRGDNGSGNQRLGLPLEHHRRPPISGSQGGGTQGQRSSDGLEGNSSRPASGTNIVGDVLYNIAPEDEEGRSRQRILTFAAKRYSTAVERNPDDHDALYNWALVLQESADNTGAEVGNSGKDGLLEEACRKYEAATELCPTLHEAFYNWAIAISDRAKIRGRTKEAEDLWKQACERYDKSVQLNWNSPQALNNWGLALQELGAIVPLKEKREIVKKAIRKFRSAIRLRFDFHRAVYNLGTVLYGLAEDTLRGGRKLSVREPTPTDLYSQSAIYIAAAHALKPDYPVYRSALRLVRSMLPLPYVKAGYLTIPPIGDSLAPHKDWQRLWFVLDHESLHEMEKLDRKSLSMSTSRRSSGIGESSSSSASLRPSMLRIEMEDIVCMTPCADLSLPPGGGCRIDTLTGHQFLIADTWEAMDGWIDAIRLVYTIFAGGKRDSLAGVLAG